MSETFYADFVGKLLIILNSFRFAHHTLTIRFTLGSIPPPIKYLVDNYYMPDFENVVMNSRRIARLSYEWISRSFSRFALGFHLRTNASVSQCKLIDL